ncbi:hypothetical protein PISMIDRAFT_527526 [Pisolithus microcarpus 441]|uniref:Uncharacterized protein n=1 Tax=Pisolithus microcarpus 441 TaxID=765257 RepID=A0A0C9ZQI1_9AGAM|nr:hypothetical protein PISMIDRAFT_527526 [Pisolithus microcarpus 441]
MTLLRVDAMRGVNTERGGSATMRGRQLCHTIGAGNQPGYRIHALFRCSPLHFFVPCSRRRISFPSTSDVPTQGSMFWLVSHSSSPSTHSHRSSSTPPSIILSHSSRLQLSQSTSPSNSAMMLRTQTILLSVSYSGLSTNLWKKHYRHI